MRKTMYTYQTGRFSYSYSWVNRYHMIIHDIGGNYTWVEPIKDRREKEMMFGRTRSLKRMKLCGIFPKHWVLDNEASQAYKGVIQKSGMNYQLVLLDDHKCNIAYKSIQTWKVYFISVLSGTTTTFLMHLWWQLITQVEKQLLLLAKSWENPKILAYAYLYGPHNYNALPFLPIGMEDLIHKKPTRRKTFAEHCKN